MTINWNYPIRLQFGNASILVHGVLEAIGIFLAFRYYLWLRRRNGDTIDSSNRIWIIIGASFGAVLGSRIIGAFENVPEWAAATNRLTYFWGNKTLVGGLLGGLIGVEIVKSFLNERQKSGDLFVYPLLLGMLIGRMGCLSTGIYEQTFGLVTKVPWAMDLGDGLRRHPVVVYEMLFLAMWWTLLFILQRRLTLEKGAAFKIFLIGYLSFRFFLDFLKPGWKYAFGLGTIQLTCLTGLTYYSRYLLRPKLLIAPKTIYNAR